MNDKPNALDIADASYATRAWEPPLRVSGARAAKRRLAVLAFLVRQRVAFALVLAIGLVCVFALLHVIPKTYEASSRVLIVATNTGRDPSVTSVDVPSLATSTVLLSRIHDKLQLPIALLDLKHGVKASVAARSSLIEISYRDKLASRAMLVANAIADELVSYYDSIASNGAELTIGKLDRAIDDVARRLRTIDDQIARQTREHPFIQSDHALDGVTAKLDDLVTQRRQASIALETDIAARNAISGDAAIEHKAVRYEKLQNDPMYHELAADIARDQAELTVARTTLTDDHPTVRALAARLRAERAMNQTNVRTTLSSAESFSSTEASASLEVRKADAAITADRAKLAGIDALIGAANTRLHDTLNAGAVAERLKLQHDAAKADYLALTAQRATAVASRAESLSLGSLVVVDRAVKSDTTVVGLGATKLGIALGFLVFLIAVLVAYVIDSLDEKLVRAEQIERFYGVPLVALIDMES